MSKSDWLIVGLGNPGSKYKDTRHNIGWMVADEFAKKHKVEFVDNPGVCGFTVFKFKGLQIALAKPTTYMNDSGRAVAWLAKKYQVSPENIVVILDEYNFPVGRIHIRNSGSDGGHNGMSSIIEKLGSNAFYRLRCGIGNDFSPGEMADYVLSNFPMDTMPEVQTMISHSIDAIEALCTMGAARSLSLINSGRLWKPKPSPSGKE